MWRVETLPACPATEVAVTHMFALTQKRKYQQVVPGKQAVLSRATPLTAE